MSEVRWLIETGSPATWLKSIAPFETWTDDANEAIGFCRKRDAVEVSKPITHTAKYYITVCDHMFMDEPVYGAKVKESQNRHTLESNG